MRGRLTAAGLAAGLALIGATAGTARADYTETFCAGGAPGAPWGAPSSVYVSPFVGENDLCASGGGYEFSQASASGGATQASGAINGSSITLPGGLVATGISGDFMSEAPSSGSSAFDLVYQDPSTQTSIAFGPMGSASVDAPVSATLPDATAVLLAVLCTSSSPCDYAQPAVVTGQALTLTLHDTTTPTVSATGGSLLAKGPIKGAQTISYTAAAGGSGVASVTVALGSTVVGTVTSACQSAVLQPCPASTSGSVTVNTAAVPDGSYPVVLTADNASGDPTSVTVGTVLTRNDAGTVTLTPGLKRLHVRVRLEWTWTGKKTTLVGVRVRRLRGREHLAVSCAGRHCPFHTRSTDSRGLKRFVRRLHDVRFDPGQRLRVTLTAPHRRAERARLVIVSGAIPHRLR